jgi:hypothetical protein
VWVPSGRQVREHGLLDLAEVGSERPGVQALDVDVDVDVDVEEMAVSHESPALTDLAPLPEMGTDTDTDTDTDR